MGLAVHVSELTSVTCCQCGTIFGISNEYEYALRKSHALFYCPNGHQQYFTGESDAERAKRTQKELDAERLRHNMTRAALDQEKKRKERLQKRVKAGVCPCCKRSFSALGRHMATKHPDYAEPAQ